MSGEHEDTGYDVIMCLSVSKWIHLNYGDTGILRLFDKVHSLLGTSHVHKYTRTSHVTNVYLCIYISMYLVEGGLFIFEYQGWLSYKKRKHLTPEIKVWYLSFETKDTIKILMTSYVKQGGVPVHCDQACGL